MSGQEARDDERGELIAELHGVTVVFGDMSPIGNLARRAREAVEAKHPEPEVEYVRGGVCLLCGGAVMDNGSHLDPERHTEEVDRITSGRKHPKPEITAREGMTDFPVGTIARDMIGRVFVRTDAETYRWRTILGGGYDLSDEQATTYTPVRILWVPGGEGERRGDVSR